MQELINFFTQNGIAIAEILCLLYVLCTVIGYILIGIAKLTTSKKDDEFANKYNTALKKVAEFLLRFGIDVVKRSPINIKKK